MYDAALYLHINTVLQEYGFNIALIFHCADSQLEGSVIVMI